MNVKEVKSECESPAVLPHHTPSYTLHLHTQLPVYQTLHSGDPAEQMVLYHKTQGQLCIAASHISS